MRNVLLFILVLFTACSKTQIAPSMSPSTPEPVPVAISLKNVVEAFNKANLPLTDSFVYDERTDINHLLGRPNGYVEKMNFRDARMKVKFKPKTNEERDMQRTCSIEVFASTENAQRRKDYIEAIGKSSPIFSAYCFLYRNILVRIDTELVPSDANEYKAALESL